MSAEPTSLTSENPVRRSGSAPAGPSLRERKKARTRRTIRTEAFRLFRQQGYSQTTVEQIAEAADVSPATFFRYFPSKEQVVLADDLDPIMIERFAEQPAELSVLEALRRTMLDTFESLENEQFEFERERAALVRTVPELRGVLAQELDRNVDMISAMFARRLGRDPGDFEVRALAGALIGAAQAVIMEREDPFDPEIITRVLNFLSSGMRL
ncbi:TetR family transcriptional regulator [Nocardia huaxiensis]|uniref:TetR family transcriptional regulator n=1 Tax=Nocardia huaxiensis TaxID=2755382 RepID=A0A7D6VDM5_9NOCA|nr:TetR family transcriptional regulator [Nocardia huaxiensis]QLY32002.1 TetR family transcriptional regulator [Nocardia huaxiensis]UFS95575.1 TetR family transcriptional regulator [Nocardia huaxiensis]